MEMNKEVGKRESKKPKKPSSSTSEIHPGRQSPVPVLWTDSKEANKQPKDEKVQQIY